MAEPRLGRFVTVDGRRAHVHVEGEGPAVVVLHGWCSIGEEVLPAFRPIGARGRLIVPDRPGYGFTDPLPEDRRGPSDQAAWLAGLLTALGIERAAIVGHSFGAAVALAFASRYPQRVAGLTLVAGFCRPTPHAGLPVLRAALSPILGPVLRERLVPPLAPFVGPWFMAACFRPNGVPDYLADFPYHHVATPATLATMASEILAFQIEGATVDAAAMAGFDGPATAIYGATDLVAEPAHHIPRVREVVPGVAVTVLDGVGHAPHHAAREAVLAAVAGLG